MFWQFSDSTTVKIFFGAVSNKYLFLGRNEEYKLHCPPKSLHAVDVQCVQDEVFEAHKDRLH